MEHSSNTPSTEAGEVSAKYLCFLLGGRSYGVSILRIKEIIEYSDITPLPMMPACFRGAINLRGRAVPVVDLAKRLSQQHTGVERRTCIVITEVETGGEQFDVGLLVDGVTRVADIAPADIEAPPSFGGAIDTRFMHGVGKVNGSFVVLLNIDLVLTFEELEALREVDEADLHQGSESGRAQESHFSPTI